MHLRNVAAALRHLSPAELETLIALLAKVGNGFDELVGAHVREAGEGD